MQYLLTQEEYDKLDSKKATKLLVDFVSCIRRLTSLDPLEDPQVKDIVQKGVVRELTRIASDAGADASEVETFWYLLVKGSK